MITDGKEHPDLRLVLQIARDKGAVGRHIRTAISPFQWLVVFDDGAQRIKWFIPNHEIEERRSRT
jgi:hypothetical protein